MMSPVAAHNLDAIAALIGDGNLVGEILTRGTKTTYVSGLRSSLDTNVGSGGVTVLGCAHATSVGPYLGPGKL